MIVKFLGNRGGGNAAAVMNYMLGKDRNRDGAVLISGDPELTARMADNLNFKNRYTVGVLSFEESDLEQQQKDKIMQSFENTLLAGLERDQYDITWIEHRDKGRLELNFVIPNVELSTGKRLQPYYDKADRPLVENWKQVTNHEYGLTDPHDPTKSQAVKSLNRQNLPKDVQQVKEQIGQVIANQIELGNITDRTGVVDTLERAGFEVARQTNKSISIKNPDGKRNIRLEGVIYEDRRLGKELAKDHSRAKQSYAGTGAERYKTASAKLQQLTARKLEANRDYFTRERGGNQEETARTTGNNHRGFAFEYTQRGGFGFIAGDNARNGDIQPMAMERYSQATGAISRNTTEHRANTASSSNSSESNNRQEQRWDILDRGKKREKGDSGRIGRWQAFNDVGVGDHAERLSKRLQRISERIRGGIERVREGASSKIRTDSAITSSKSAINAASRDIEQRKQQTVQHEQSTERVNQEIRKTQKALGR